MAVADAEMAQLLLARTGFNSKTQEEIKIPAKTVVKFRVAKAAKHAVLG
jgi:DNA-binding protein HU-beta